MLVEMLSADYVYYEFGRYYEGGVSSVYFWDLDDGFAGVVLLKKSRCILGPSRMDCFPLLTRTTYSHTIRKERGWVGFDTCL